MARSNQNAEATSRPAPEINGFLLGNITDAFIFISFLKARSMTARISLIGKNARS